MEILRFWLGGGGGECIYSGWNPPPGTCDIVLVWAILMPVRWSGPFHTMTVFCSDDEGSDDEDDEEGEEEEVSW